MIIELAKDTDKREIVALDRHVPPERLSELIRDGFVCVLRGDVAENGGRIAGVLRYSLFWQTIPFLDLIYLDEACRGKGYGREMMNAWEDAVSAKGYRYVMTSTQTDEDAQYFYEKLGYIRVGGFFPPEQEAEEAIYLKELNKNVQ